MGKNIQWILVLMLTVLLIGSSSLCATQEDQKKNQEKSLQSGVQHKKEGWFKNYFAPWIPVISVLFATAGGALINHYYWKKREETTRRNKISDERINSYLKFCEYNLAFNAYTDHIMRLEEKKQKLSEGKERQDAEQSIRELEDKRIDALKGLRHGIGYARIFFKSDKVDSSIKAYTELYDKIRIEEKDWDVEGIAFNDLLKLSKEIEFSIEDELKNEMKEPQKRRWWQCKNVSCF